MRRVLGSARTRGRRRARSTPPRAYIAVTWDAALRIADDQIAEWERLGITPVEAEAALRNEGPARWQRVRKLIAAWVMLHRDRWEG